MSYVRPSATAAAVSWSGDTAYVRPSATAASTDWLEGEIREPIITATSSAEAVSLVTAVSVGTANANSSADGTHSGRTADTITGVSFVIGTENAAGVTKGDANGSASSEAVGHWLITATGEATGSASVSAASLVSLTSTGVASGAASADGRGIFNKDFAGIAGGSSKAQGRSAAYVVSVGTCNGRASVGIRVRPNISTKPDPMFSLDGVAVGVCNGRASVGRKPKWRLARVLIPQFGAPGVGTIASTSSTVGVSVNG